MGFSRQEYWNGKIKEQRGLYLRDFNAFNRKPTHVKKMILVEAPSTWTEKTEIVQNEKWPGEEPQRYTNRKMTERATHLQT